ncbi:phosphate ABC transporter permease subunit PstC [Bacillus lacus]|uniref:Phosphate transport system permease protein n=1 Tax=Metabacillus lacus TaxID=1983721 RepID=A0A7X2IYU8_9BACI|nr:phosphate ABC transporter permease subunit PstC [Metabacillus lacus]MRX72159.1 phosphate ABC transporter permease subunit PstC [Metabacillus lacus]
MAKIEQDLQTPEITIGSEITKNRKGTYFKNSSFQIFCFSSAIILGIVLLSIIVFIGKTGLLVFEDVSVTEFFFSTTWEPFDEKYGAATFIIGTLSLTALTLVFATPISIAVAVFIVEVAPDSVKRVMRPILDLLVGIPSIVYGYLGLTILIPFIREATGSIMGDGLLAAALVLTLMVLPTITRISDDVIASVPREFREASYAMGSTRLQTIFRIILPAAKQGIVTAVILGMARAVGETMAVVMVIGNTPQLATDLLTPTSVLTSNIVMQILNVEFQSTWNYALYMMAFLLLLISMFMIIVIRRIRTKGV